MSAIVSSRLIRSSQSSRSRALPTKQTRRAISNYLSDVLRTGSFSPSDPISETFDKIYHSKENQESEETSSTSTRTDDNFKRQIPHFSVWKPHHLEAAAPKLKLQYEHNISALQEKLSSSNPSSPSPAFLKEIVSDWDQIHAPIKYLHNSSFLMGILSDSSFHKDWRMALAKVNNQTLLPNPMNEALLDQYPNEELLALFYNRLKKGLEQLDTTTQHQQSNNNNNKSTTSTTNDEEDWLWAARHWERAIRHATGLNLSSTEDQESFRQHLDAMQGLEHRMLTTNNDTSSNPPTKEQLAQILSDGYGIIELRRRNAQLLGYKDFVDQTLESRQRMAKNVDEIQNLHESVADRVLPVVENMPSLYDPFDRQFFKPGELHNPTLDGAILALSKLVYDLFGVEIRKEDNPKDRDLAVWNKDVWLFHLLDHESKTQDDDEPQYLGSIFLDPFKRPGKLRRSFLAPLVVRGPNNAPLVAISLDISPPVWNDLPAEIQWEDVESLFHETGHALQLILARSTLGGVCGGHNLPLDVSEIMPKFMEHCLFSESMLTTIMECSETNHGTQTLTPEMVEKLQVWRHHRKAKQIMQHVFFGSLELELFSSFDPRGDETLVGLQRRLATQYVPHDMPQQKDLSPFLDIMGENARGTHIAYYRYLWSEVYSAGLYQSFPGDMLGEATAANSRKQGATFRRDFLDPGASLDPEKALRKFDEGGQPAIEAMLNLFQVPRS